VPPDTHIWDPGPDGAFNVHPELQVAQSVPAFVGQFAPVVASPFGHVHTFAKHVCDPAPAAADIENPRLHVEQSSIMYSHRVPFAIAPAKTVAIPFAQEHVTAHSKEVND
jgi:hypothetical protein